MEDVEKIFQETAATLSIGQLKGLVEQEESKNIDSNDFHYFTTITEIMDQFIENYSNFDSCSKSRRGVIDALSTYQQLLTERKRKTQARLDAF